MKIEKKIKKQLSQEIGSSKEPNENLYERITKDMQLNQNRPVRKNKWVPLITALSVFLVVLVSGILLISNSSFDKKSYAAIVQMDVNPSIEMVVDEQNRVVSVRGLNDEGKMIIYGETIINKNLEEAIEIIIRVETDLGYLNHSDENKITFTVSAKTTDIIEKIASKAEEDATKALAQLGITATIEKINGYVKEELAILAKQLDPTLTDEEIANFSYDQLVNVVKLYHLEVIDYASVKLEEYYQEFKKYEINLAEKEYIKEGINNLGSLYQTFYASYLSFCDNLENEFVNMQKAYYDTFIASDSDYQQAWANLATLKEAYLAQKNVVANLPEDASLSDTIAENQKLIKAKAEYELAEQTLNAIEVTSKASYELACAGFEMILESLKQIEQSLPKDITAITLQTVQNTEQKMNEFKNQLCSKFEEAHQDEIDQYKQTIRQRKESLKQSLH